FKEAMHNLNKMEVHVISSNYLFSGRHVGKTLGLSEKIGQGLLNSALQIECSKPYLANDPEFVADILLDVKRELFDK
ncbi:hypothetical protein ACFLXY_10805, partial [Chloroflexota bacterium]